MTMKNNTWAPASYSGIISELAYIYSKRAWHLYQQW